MKNIGLSKKIEIGNVVEIEFEDGMVELGVVYNIEDDIASLVMCDGTIIHEADLSSLKYKFRHINAYTKSNPDYS